MPRAREAKMSRVKRDGEMAPQAKKKPLCGARFRASRVKRGIGASSNGGRYAVRKNGFRPSQDDRAVSRARRKDDHEQGGYP